MNFTLPSLGVCLCAFKTQLYENIPSRCIWGEKRWQMYVQHEADQEVQFEGGNNI